MKNLSKINSCQICNKPLKKALDLGHHPLCDDLLKINTKRKNKEYPIIINYCNFCHTAFQKFQVRKKVLFPKSYHYRARFTNDVVRGQKDLVENIKKDFGSLKNKIVLDIGCNDGTLLDVFKKQKSITVGVEPTNAYKDASNSHDIYGHYLNKTLAKKIKIKYKKIDIITFTNVFAHINNLNELLDSLKILLSNKTILVIENHYLGSVINKKQFDTFYHEHPRTYSLTSFLKISKRLNLCVNNFDFPKRYGGNIRVILTNTDKKKKLEKKIITYEKNFYKKLINLGKFIETWKTNKKKEILKLNKKYGPLPAKAFPGRAAILLKLLNLNKNNISSIYEKKNSKKIGYYAPGTKIPITSDIYLKRLDKNIPILNLAWHIDKEIKKYLLSNKISNKIYNIVSKRDFNKKKL